MPSAFDGTAMMIMSFVATIVRESWKANSFFGKRANAAGFHHRPSDPNVVSAATASPCPTACAPKGRSKKSPPLLCAFTTDAYTFAHAKSSASNDRAIRNFSCANRTRRTNPLRCVTDVTRARSDRRSRDAGWPRDSCANSEEPSPRDRGRRVGRQSVRFSRVRRVQVS